jgi:hypothetical protein
MLGLMRSLYGPCRRAGVRIGSVHPGFAGIVYDQLFVLMGLTLH